MRYVYAKLVMNTLLFAQNKKMRRKFSA